MDKRRQLESEVKKYSDPPSEHLLPDLPPEHRCARPLDSSCAKITPAALVKQLQHLSTAETCTYLQSGSCNGSATSS